MDQPLMKYGVNAVLAPRAVGAQVGAFGGALPHPACLFIGKPHARQIVAAQQVRQHQRIHAVSFDFGFGNSARAQRVRHHYFGAQRR